MTGSLILAMGPRMLNSEVRETFATLTEKPFEKNDVQRGSIHMNNVVSKLGLKSDVVN